MVHKQDGFTLIESLIVLVVIGALFFFLIEALDIDALQNKAKNATLQSDMVKIILSVDSFVNSYQISPTEEEFFKALLPTSIEYENSCTLFGFARYECLFRPGSRKLPESCDLSAWRFDRKDTKPCYFRYYGGPALLSNRGASFSNYRLYVKMFGKENSFYVHDSSEGSVLYKCPGTINDFDNLEECYVI